MSANMMHTKHCELVAAGPQFLRSMGDSKINPDESPILRRRNLGNASSCQGTRRKQNSSPGLQH